MSTTPLPIEQFAQKVRDKYPGAYDSLSDSDLIQRITTKYPQYKANIASYAPTQFEKDNAPQPVTATSSGIDPNAHNPVSRTLSAAGGAALSGLDTIGGAVLNAPRSLLHAITSPLETAKSIDSGVKGLTDSIGNAVDYYRGNPSWEGIKSVLPEAVGMGIGNTAVGEAPGAVAEVGPLAGDAARSARGAVSKALYSNGELKPSVVSTSQGLGALAGATPGLVKANPYAAVAGGTAGYKIGPSITRTLFPAPPEYPGASLPSTDDFYAAKAEDLNNRGAEQAALDKQTVSEGKAWPLSRSPYAANYKRDLLSGQYDPLADSPNAVANKQNALTGQSTSLAESPNAVANKMNALSGQSDSLADSPNAVLNKMNALSGQNTSLSDSPYLPRYKAAQADLQAVPLSQSPNARTYPRASTLDEVYGPQVNATSTDPYAPTGSPDDLISRTKKIVIPGEAPSAADLKRAGDLTQAPLPRLQQLASFGDELAKNEINRRLRNQ